MSTPVSADDETLPEAVIRITGLLLSAITVNPLLIAREEPGPMMETEADTSSPAAPAANTAIAAA